MTYVIVPTFGRVEQTRKLVAGLAGRPEVHFIIVDDHPDHPYSILPEFLDCTVLYGTGTLFWGGAINLGVRHYLDSLYDEADIVVFANHDVTIDAEDYERLLAAYKSDRLIHPLVYDHLGNMDSVGLQIVSQFPYWTRNPVYRNRFTRVQFVTARFLMMSARIVHSVGTIPREIPHYGGDYYYSYEASKHGYSTVIYKDSRCVVDDSETGAKGKNTKNLDQLLRSFVSIHSPNCLKYKNRLFRIVFQNPFYRISAFMASYFAVFFRFAAVNIKRLITRSARIVVTKRGLILR